MMKKILLTLLLFLAMSIYAEVNVKVKDIAYIDGMKENQIMGFGLVVGLEGTGDSKINVTEASLKNLLKNMGLHEDNLSSSKNVAAVMVTANLPQFVRVGDRVTVTVSSIGDAKSLQGGILLQSPLKGADNNIYLVAQGAVSVGKKSLNSRDKTKTNKTVGTITRGGIVEREITHNYIQNNSISIILKEFDFGVANEISEKAKEEYPNLNVQIQQDGKIRFAIPQGTNISEFISKIENIEVAPPNKARVVISERDGTIVMGGDVKISSVVISKAGMTITVQGEDKDATAKLLEESSTVKDLVDALNYIGLAPSDLVSVLKALKDAGALHAELIIQ